MEIEADRPAFKILAVDDDPEQLFTLVKLLESHEFEVLQAINGQAALEVARKELPDLILMDVNMPQVGGLEATSQLKQDSLLKKIPVVLLTSKDSPEEIRNGLNVGADDYISKPFKSVELIARVRTALKTGDLYRQIGRLRAEVGRSEGDLIAKSGAMQKALLTLERAEKTDIPILLTGETGTGKELAAKRIHNRSARSAAPFFAVNCAVFQPQLLRSELFGHVKGAFTGAVTDRQGLFAASDGGTLLLDEIGEMEIELQAQLLRVLEDGSFQPLGSTKSQTCDVRIIAATHRNLEEMVAKGAFRKDLFYRINVLEISLPPLRSRREDIKPLIDRFLAQAKQELKLDTPQEISTEAMTLLESYDWPGNVRQLKNEIYRIVALSEGQKSVSLSLLSERVRANKAKNVGTSDSVSGSEAQSESLKKAIEELEKKMIGEALVSCGGNKSEAARKLEIARSSLISKIKEYGL